MKDNKGKSIEEGDNIKYSFNDFGVPQFTGRVITQEDGLYVEHSNKVKVKLDDSIKFIEILDTYEF